MVRRAWVIAVAVAGCHGAPNRAPAEPTRVSDATIVWNVHAVAFASLDTCFVGNSCSDGACCEFRTASGEVVRFADDAALHSVAPDSAPVGAACVHTDLDAAELASMQHAISTFVDDVRRDSHGYIDVRVRHAALTPRVALERLMGLGGCTFWPSPAVLRPLLAHDVGVDVDTVSVVFDTTIGDGTKLAMKVPYCDLAPSLFEGLGGAGVVVIPRTEAWTDAAGDLGCVRPINFHHGIIGHNLDAALALAGFRSAFAVPGSQASQWNPDAAPYPACGTRPTRPYVPDIHDAEADPDFEICGYASWKEYCAAVGPTHDTCNARFQAHRLTHVPRDLVVVGNHCRTGRIDADELGQDCGGMHCAPCGAPAPPAVGVHHVSDLQLQSATSGWGPVERDRSNGERTSLDGHRLRIGAVTYAKGLGVHAPSEITIDLARRCEVFRAHVGVDAEVDSRGSVTFEVIADGRMVASSNVLRGGDAPFPLTADIRNARTLVLRVTDAGDNNHSDHADWGDAVLECSGR